MTLVYKSIIGIGALCTSIGILTFIYFPLYSFKGFEKALEGVLLLSSIGLGFYGACLSVLAAVFNTKAVKEIMKDEEYKKEFIFLSLTTLLISFITIFITIIYQVFLENGKFSDLTLDIVNALWIGLTSGFMMMNILFILISFMIFFVNDA